MLSHKLSKADLFSSGASAEEIEEYVLSSLKEGSDKESEEGC